MPYRVILPFDYEERKNAGRQYPVLYLLHGLWGHYDNWTDKTKIVSLARGHNVIIVMPEGGDGWYLDSAVRPNDKYESYIIKELIPTVEHEYRAINDRRGRAVAGLSMGGYGAIKFGLKYPDKFVFVGSMSGALNGTKFTGTKDKEIGQLVDQYMGPIDSQVRKDNDIFDLVSKLKASGISALPFIYMDCGTEDFLFAANRDFSSLLQEKKIPHEYRELPGAHTWPYWEQQIQEILRKTDAVFSPDKGKDK